MIVFSGRSGVAGALLMALGLTTNVPFAVPGTMPSAHAQESLAGLGAASGIGATLGATAAGSLSSGRATRGVGQPGAGFEEESGGAPGTAGAAGGGPNFGNTGGAAAPAALPYVPPPPGRTVSGQAIVQNLRSVAARRRTTSTTTRTRTARPAATSRAARRTAAASAQARSKQRQARYQIPPVDWRAQYLPQDRYKLGKVWRYVSTQDSSFYYRPQDLARRKFNPNRVIGFHSWQAALQAGYRPDPLSQPEPAPQIVALSNRARGDNFYRFVEYVYAGRVSPAAFDATASYANRVANAISRYSYARGYVSPTLDRVFLATLTGNPGLIPRTVGGQPRVRTRVTTSVPARAPRQAARTR